MVLFLQVIHLIRRHTITFCLDCGKHKWSERIISTTKKKCNVWKRFRYSFLKCKHSVLFLFLMELSVLMPSFMLWEGFCRWKLCSRLYLFLWWIPFIYVPLEEIMMHDVVPWISHNLVSVKHEEKERKVLKTDFQIYTREANIDDILVLSCM